MKVGVADAEGPVTRHGRRPGPQLVPPSTLPETMNPSALETAAAQAEGYRRIVFGLMQGMGGAEFHGYVQFVCMEMAKRGA